MNKYSTFFLSHRKTKPQKQTNRKMNILLLLEKKSANPERKEPTSPWVMFYFFGRTRRVNFIFQFHD